MKHLIIGGGIAGLHIALQLLDKNENDFLILEKAGYNESKIFSIKDNIKRKDGTTEEVLIELGPSVFHDKQVELMKLIKRLNLQNTFEFVNPKEKAYYVYPGMTSDEAKKKWREIKKRVFEETTNETLEEASKRILNDEDYKLLKTCWGEWYEVKDDNLQVLKKSLKEEGNYIVMKGGLSQIIEKATTLIKDKIQFNNKVIKVSYNKNNYTVYDSHNNLYNCEKIYLCANLKGAREIEFEGINEVNEYLSLGKIKHCLRCYTYFNKPISIPYKFIMGNFIGKYSIKYSDNLWLVAYPDDILALKLYNMRKEWFIKDWIEMVNKNFHLSLTYDDTLNKYCGYWEDAYCTLTPEFYEINSEGILKGEKLRNELNSKNILITSLPKDKGENTAWMEGHLLEI